MLTDAPLEVIGHAGIQGSGEATHDVHPFVAAAPQGRLHSCADAWTCSREKAPGFSRGVSRSPERSRRARARMTEGAFARPTTAPLQCPAVDLWDMISPQRS